MFLLLKTEKRMLNMYRIWVGLSAACLMLSTSARAQSALDDAAKESMRRQAAKVELRSKLAMAQEAEKAGKSAEASRIYEDKKEEVRNLIKRP